jgi:hypothetical protein
MPSTCPAIGGLAQLRAIYAPPVPSLALVGIAANWTGDPVAIPLNRGGMTICVPLRLS